MVIRSWEQWSLIHSRNRRNGSVISSLSINKGRDLHLRRQITSDEPISREKSEEIDLYALEIIHSVETGKFRVVYANVENKHLIDNLPQGCCVEVPCLVDREGIDPCHIGDLPSQCAALNRTNINLQELTVEAILNGNKEAVYQAVALDPLSSSLLTLQEAKAMTDELLEAQRKYLPDWK